MVEKEQVFSSRVKYNGIFSFTDYYKFCYEWLTKEMGLDLSEDAYIEKLNGDAKDVTIEWSCEKLITDYFKVEIKIRYVVIALKDVEITQGNAKVKTNKGDIEMTVIADLIRDYRGKFETNPFRKFLRNVYEKWIIASEIERYKERIIIEADEFIAQAKAYLDLEGRR